jgi:hypothetical protein
MLTGAVIRDDRIGFRLPAFHWHGEELGPDRVIGSHLFHPAVSADGLYALLAARPLLLVWTPSLSNVISAWSADRQATDDRWKAGAAHYNATWSKGAKSLIPDNMRRPLAMRLASMTKAVVDALQQQGGL